MIQQRPRQHWLFDRRVPIGLVAAIALQTAVGLIWAGQFVQRLAVVEQRTSFAKGTSERIARLEENTSHMRRSLERMEYKLDHWKDRTNAVKR